ncbi:MAG: type VI secretion system ATPase TssH, partial [Alistipes sp.]|nr:type VI secretion system ATPase TssH [Alistipes sp.]
MNINTLTIKAQEMLQRAVSLARDERQQAVEPLHVLNALVEKEDSLAWFLLQRVGVNPRTVLQEVRKAVGSLPRVEGADEQYFATDTTRLIQRAVDYTKPFGDKYASVEHLLLALVKERGRASELLRGSGASEQELLEAVRTFRRGSKV